MELLIKQKMSTFTGQSKGYWETWAEVSSKYKKVKKGQLTNFLWIKKCKVVLKVE